MSLTPEALPRISPVVGPPTEATAPDAPLLHLLGPKWLTARARAKSGEQGKGARTALLAGVGAAFWTFIFSVVFRLLTYFRGVPEIGQLLAGKLLGVMLLSFFGILLLSNVITALSSFFLAKDLDLLVSGPVDWLSLYAAKLVETIIASSWMVALMAVPMFAAFGVAYDGGWAFAPFAFAVMIPFFVIPAVTGGAFTLLLVNVFPARRTKDIFSVIAVVSAAGIVLLFRLVRPEKLAHPEGFRSLVDFVSVLRTPTSPVLPSEWVQKSMMGLLTSRADWLAVYMLWTTAAACVVMGAVLHRSFYLTGFSRAQESAQRWSRDGRLSGLTMRALRPFGILRRELLMKELRLFFRDSTQWSQLILLAVLVVAYVLNVKFLPLSGEGITVFLRNVVPFLNLATALYLRDLFSGSSKWVAMASGFSAAISVVIALAYVPVLPISAILTIFIVGLLPASPVLNVYVVARMSWTIAPEHPGRWLAAVALSFAMVAGVESWARLTTNWIRQASSYDPKWRAAAAEKLRWFGSSSAVLAAARDRQPRYQWPWSSESRPTVEEGRRAYFLMTGHAVEDSKWWHSGQAEEKSFDPERGGENVGAAIEGLDLGSSRLDGAVYPKDRLAAVDWTITFRNRTQSAHEARAEVQLPRGGVVSGVSLWVKDVEQPGTFWGAKEVRKAYQAVVAVRRDPMLVTWRGDGRVMMQCFPVPAEGEMKIKLSITAPLDEFGKVAMPQFNERNFGIRRSAPVWVDVEGATRSGEQFLQASSLVVPTASWVPDGTEYAIRQTFVRPADRVPGGARSSWWTAQTPWRVNGRS